MPPPLLAPLLVREPAGLLVVTVVVVFVVVLVAFVELLIIEVTF